MTSKVARIVRQLRPIHLLHLAYGHLPHLHGRYLLRRKATGELELNIVDSWQGDAARDTLNASGKMIGVISHVEGMKERIPAQIRVEKGGGVGYSRLSI